MENIGLKIKRKRTEKGLYQEHLAKALHVDRSVISKWETGVSEPSIEQLKQISVFFNVPVDYFLNDNSHDNSEVSINSSESIRELIHNHAIVIGLSVISLFTMPLSLPLVCVAVWLSFKKKMPTIIKIVSIFPLLVFLKDILFMFGIDILPSIKTVR